MKQKCIIIVDSKDSTFTYRVYKTLISREINVKFAYISDMYLGSDMITLDTNTEVFLVKYVSSAVEVDVVFSNYDMLVVINDVKNISSNDSFIIYFSRIISKNMFNFFKKIVFIQSITISKFINS